MVPGQPKGDETAPAASDSARTVLDIVGRVAAQNQPAFRVVQGKKEMIENDGADDPIDLERPAGPLGDDDGDVAQREFPHADAVGDGAGRSRLPPAGIDPRRHFGQRLQAAFFGERRHDVELPGPGVDQEGAFLSVDRELDLGQRIGLDERRGRKHPGRSRSGKESGLEKPSAFRPWLSARGLRRKGRPAEYSSRR